jgi:hypothetical protein
MLSRIYIQCFENNKEAEKVEVNYEILKKPEKNVSATGVELASSE